MKFDFCIGNPPYQEEAPGESTSDIPVYHAFMDAAFFIAEKVELVTPGRFLFNAGATPAVWNKKILEDEHFKVLDYQSDTKKVFPSIEIPGGIVISYRDASATFTPIRHFSQFETLKKLGDKIMKSEKEFLPSIMFSQNKFNLEALYKDYPKMKSQLGSEGRDKRFRQIIMERFPNLFTEDKGKDKLHVLGLIHRSRDYRYIKLKYVEEDERIPLYKVFVPFSNGASGTLSENESARLISKPVIGYPYDGITQTFIGVGGFSTLEEAEACLKYIKSKFTRALLGLLKVTQGNKPETWAYVPLQDFTDKSDIDWSKPIADIDRQLYRKYGLTDEEITFIETKVKEME